MCPITYQEIEKGKYSVDGLRLLSPRLQELQDFPYTQEKQKEQGLSLFNKLSIQGVQPKLSVKLNVAKQVFEIVERFGTFIFKPQNPMFPELPENESLTMKLAESVGIQIPLCGMIYSKDQKFTYFIKRFDRISKKRKLGVEDFAQLAGKTRETRYDYSMEKLVAIVDKHCSFPQLEKLKLFRLTIFNFLVGNEDMHLKNFSLLSRNDGVVELSPAYDLLNTTIAVPNVTEEIALSLKGKMKNLSYKLLVTYYAKERLGLHSKLIDDVLAVFQEKISYWENLISISFLSEVSKGQLKNNLPIFP
ncbi:MAG: HipA domain-containing protein [Spirochaetota bacterium]